MPLAGSALLVLPRPVCAVGSPSRFLASHVGHYGPLRSKVRSLFLEKKGPGLGGAGFSAGDGECREMCRRGKCLLSLRPVPNSSDLPPRL